MKKLTYSLKVIILLFISIFILSPSVFADDTDAKALKETENLLHLGDVGELHIQMDGNEISIKEIKDIQKGDTVESTTNAWNIIFNKYKGVILGISGVLTLTFVLIFLLTFIKISSSEANPQKKAEIAKSLIWVALGSAGFGSITLILSLGYGLFRD